MDTQETAVIKGKAVVPGVALGPIAVVAPCPAVPEAGAEVDEGQREAEYERFEQAANAVTEALKERAKSLEGHAADVVNATAGLASDRGWRRKVKKTTKQGVMRSTQEY